MSVTVTVLEEFPSNPLAFHSYASRCTVVEDAVFVSVTVTKIVKFPSNPLAIHVYAARCNEVEDAVFFVSKLNL